MINLITKINNFFSRNEKHIIHETKYLFSIYFQKLFNIFDKKILNKKFFQKEKKNVKNFKTNKT